MTSYYNDVILSYRCLHTNYFRRYMGGATYSIDTLHKNGISFRVTILDTGTHIYQTSMQALASHQKPARRLILMKHLPR